MKKSDKHSWKKTILLLIGVCVGMLAMWGMSFLAGGGGSDRKHLVNLEDIKDRGEKSETLIVTLQEVDYPFGYSTEGWRLVLCEEMPVDNNSGFLLRMYDQDGVLLQEFNCDMEAEELIFRFDGLYSYYGWDEDLEIFPADAEETGASGLLFPWDTAAKRFGEEPIEIPWYEEIGSRNAYLVKSTEGNGETIRVYRINEETRVPVELRRWMLTKSDMYDEEGHRASVDLGLSGEGDTL